MPIIPTGRSLTRETSIASLKLVDVFECGETQRPTNRKTIGQTAFLTIRPFLGVHVS